MRPATQVQVSVLRLPLEENVQRSRTRSVHSLRLHRLRNRFERELRLAVFESPFEMLQL